MQTEMDEIMDDFAIAEKAVRAITENVVSRHRTAGVLTWSLMHQIESEVIEEAVLSGEHDPDVLNMMRAPMVMPYPRDNRAVSFAGHTAIPIVYGEVLAAWNRVH